jgi:membrane protein DedA with SNARE-associated domain
VLLENTALLGLVLPGGSLVLLRAVYAQQGAMTRPLVLVLGWLGMVLGTRSHQHPGAQLMARRFPVPS